MFWWTGVGFGFQDGLFGAAASEELRHGGICRWDWKGLEGFVGFAFSFSLSSLFSVYLWLARTFRRHSFAPLFLQSKVRKDGLGVLHGGLGGGEGGLIGLGC